MYTLIIILILVLKYLLFVDAYIKNNNNSDIKLNIFKILIINVYIINNIGSCIKLNIFEILFVNVYIKNNSDSDIKISINYNIICQCIHYK